ncbi:MAG: TRZ/ATZ family hydrolase [Gammaproteobacteria bacterium]|nr:MAG: TRZ/ATZ family hydrolase [Gammaproteobacteria bacterium]
MKKTVDLRIDAGWIVPVEPAGVVLQQHAILVHEGRILALLPSDQADAGFDATETVDLPGHVLFPGFVNAHTHAAMSLLRGLADDLPLMDWLNRHIWPVESAFVSADFVRDGTRLAIAEMLSGGTTCFNDMYFFPDVSAQVCEQAGMRAVVGLIVIDFPSAWAGDWRDYLRKGMALHESLRNSSLVSCAFAPHAPYSVSDEPLAEIARLSAENGLPVHIHVHESEDELRSSVEQYGVRPLARLDRLGLINERLLAVHGCHLDDAEQTLLAQKHAHVVHCPQSNLKLASGFCPVAGLLDKGAHVALGTDGAASNNDLDMLSEMRSAALLAKGVSGDPTTLPAHQALRMATLSGAEALGMADETGSLTTGKWADMAALDLHALNTQPVYDPVSQLVYAAASQQIQHVWVAGRPMLRHGELLSLDTDKVIGTAQAWRARIAEHIAGNQT